MCLAGREIHSLPKSLLLFNKNQVVTGTYLTTHVPEEVLIGFRTLQFV
jgi:hypothetical protein